MLLIFYTTPRQVDQTAIRTQPNGEHIDIFLDKFRMDHTLDFRKRLKLDNLTIPVTDLLLTKLQIVRIAEKDLKRHDCVLEIMR